MKERPILFSGEMVKAILEGRKTQTRRIVKGNPINPGGRADGYFQRSGGDWFVEYRTSFAVVDTEQAAIEYLLSRCPYGAQGERLWVRETFAIESNDGYQDVYTVPEKPLGPVRHSKPDNEGITFFECPRYRASEPDTILGDDENGMKWKPSIFMPRWASRITLEVTAVRVERVQDISPKDAVAEGLYVWPQSHTGNHYGIKQGDVWEADPTLTFKRLWDSINGKPRKNGVNISWAANPWVWITEFKLLNEKNS